jgi:hypothetical protein
MFQCEICKDVYHLRNEALECESFGKEVKLAEIGQIVEYEMHVSGGFPSFYVPVRISDIIDKGHYFVYYFEEYDEDEKEWVEFGRTIWSSEEFINNIRT